MTEKENGKMKLSVKVEQGKGWKRTLQIEVPRETVEAEFRAKHETYRDLAKIPGFRKGKAPMDMVKRRFKDAIHKDVLESLLPKAYEDAIKEQNLSPISMPEVKEVQFEEGTPLKFKAEIEIKPEVKVKDYKGLQVVKRTKKTTPEEVEKTLDRLREDFAELHPVERKSKFYDHLVVDLEKEQDGKTEKIQNHQMILDPHNTIKDFQDALIKTKAGETREFEMSYPADFHSQQLAGKTVKYKVEVKEIKEKILPELNDQFAKTLGEYKTLAELKNKIEEGLKEKAQKDSDTDLKNALASELLKRNPFEVPDALIDYYMETLIKDLKTKYKTVDEKKVREEYLSIAVGHIKWDLLFHQIAEKENIEVTKEQIETWIETFAGDYKMKPEEAKKLTETPSQMKRIKEDLLEQNVVDFLLKNAKVKEETIAPESKIIKPGIIKPGDKTSDK